MSGSITVMLRGIRFRAGRSLLVLLIATIATASAVATAAYLRAAQQSVLTDTLKYAPTSQTSVVVGASGVSAEIPELDDTVKSIDRAFAGMPVLAKNLGTPIAAADSDGFFTVGDSGGMAFLAYRQNVCAHLVIVGACPSAAGQVLVSSRSAARFGLKVGAQISVTFKAASRSGTPAPPATSTIVGLYAPRNANEAFWGGNPYFADGDDAESPTQIRLDAVFTPVESEIRKAATASVDVHVEIPLRPNTVILDEAPTLAADLAKYAASAAAEGISINTGLTTALASASQSEHSLSTTIPVVAVPLIVLCLFVLFLVVTAIADERTPEFGLAKLRGYGAGRASRFGMAEMFTLIVLAMPLGVILGLGLTAVATRVVLASGTPVELRWPIIVAALGGMIAGVIAAWLATRIMLRRGVLALLRRVPSRTGWHAGLGVGIAIAFVASALVAALLNKKSPIALLAAPSIALIAGLIAARLMAVIASGQLRMSTRQGRLAGILSGAWLSRQPGRNRIVAVLTVAVALLIFGSIGWDIGSVARSNSAVDTIGADHVYTVLAPYPSALEVAVRKADPTGNSMAVVRVRPFYGDGYVEEIGVDSSAMSKVVRWRGKTASQIGSIASALRPKTAPELTVHDSMTVTADVTSVVSNTVAISALVSAPGSPPVVEPLGVLKEGTSSYTGLLAGCQRGCRFLGISIGRPAGPSALVKAELRITSITAGGVSVHDFSNAALWHPAPDRAPDAHLSLTPGLALGVTLSSTDPADALIAYQDSPVSLPVVASGGSKTSDRAAATFTFPALGADPSPMSVVDRAAQIPRGGSDSLLFDLNTASAIAERTGTLADPTNLQFEVWAGSDAPADLVDRLGSAGIAVLGTSSINDDLAQLSRGAPTLSMWFYLFAGWLALLLAVGVVLLSAFVGADTRIYEYASLKVAGVRPAVLRRAVAREYRSVLGIALIAGIAAGIAAAALMLPSIELVSVGGPVGDVPYGGRMVALYVSLIATVIAMALVVLLAMRVLHRAKPDRLRDGVR